MLYRLVFLTVLISMLAACTPIKPAAPAAETTEQTSATAAVPASGPATQNNLKLTILYDNRATDPQLKSGWGFAALMEFGGHTLLFDTGAGGNSILQDNMQQLNIDPQSIEAIILSHEHSDHTGGLQPLLDLGVRPTVYVPPQFSDNFKDTVRAQTELVEVAEPLEILPGVHVFVAGKEYLAEQSLLVETAEGSVIMLGCAHPGVAEMVSAAEEIVPGDVALLAGGFHLMNERRSSIETLVSALRDLHVDCIMPAHCTGDLASDVFRTAYGENYSDAGVGRVVVFPKD